MPPIYYLNPPPNPFWDFVAGVEDHPFFRGFPQNVHRSGPPSSPPRAAPENPRNPANTSQGVDAGLSEKAQGKQPTIEDPPEVDPSTIKPAVPDSANRGPVPEPEGPASEQHPFSHGFGNACRGRGAWGRGRGHWRGPPPFMMGNPFFAHPGWESREGVPPPGPPPHHGGPEGFRHHPHHPPHHHGPAHEHDGRPGFPFRAGTPHNFSRRGRGCHRHGSPPTRGPGFDVGDFLNKLGNKLGIDLSAATEGLGLAADKFTAGRTSQDVDFEPRTDIFENNDSYSIHLSLPGAKKSDIGVDYDGDHSVLRITGVVHRPDVDEQMLKELVVDGRKRETGVFEKVVRLGTKNDPAEIDVAGITARMQDGVLVVKVPKVHNNQHTRDVPIATDSKNDEQADYDDEYSEKPTLFDAEEELADGQKEQKRDEIDLIDMKDNEDIASSTKEKVEKVENNDEQKPGLLEKHPKPEASPSSEVDQLPGYSAEAGHEDDWEKFSDISGEGEYIKINVD